MKNWWENSCIPLITNYQRSETTKSSHYKHPYAQNKKTFCVLFCALLMHYLRYSFQSIIQWKLLLPSGINKFKANSSYDVKEIQINWESFPFARDKKFHCEIRIIVIKNSLFYVTCLLNLLSKMSSSVSFSYNNCKNGIWKR